MLRSSVTGIPSSELPIWALGWMQMLVRRNHLLSRVTSLGNQSSESSWHHDKMNRKWSKKTCCKEDEGAESCGVSGRRIIHRWRPHKMARAVRKTAPCSAVGGEPMGAWGCTPTRLTSTQAGWLRTERTRVRIGSTELVCRHYYVLSGLKNPLKYALKFMRCLEMP